MERSEVIMAKEPPGGQLRDALAPPVQRCTHKSETLLRNTTKARYGRSEWNKRGQAGVPREDSRARIGERAGESGTYL